jgi:acyl-CoA synthetase (AMP-forming)/AMP-acid ligase II
MSLANYLDNGALFGLDRVAYEKDGEKWTFDEAQKLSCRVARALKTRGFAAETKAAALSANDPKSWLCVMGFWRAGLTWVPLNPRSPLEDHTFLLDGFDVEILFFQKMFAPLVAQMREACPGVKHFICVDGKVEGALSFDEFCGDASEELLDFAPAIDSLAAILPTGGTTGKPKGVMLSHRNLGMSVMNNIMNTPYEPGEDIVNLAAAPMTHTAGFLSIPATARGGKILVVAKPDPNALLDVIADNKVTEFFLPPTVIYRLLEQPNIEDKDLSAIKYFMYGAAPMSSDKLRKAINTFGPVMCQGYGQTECAGSIAFLRAGDHFIDGKLGGEIADENRLTACGRPIVFNQVTIMDEDNKALAQGETGEICIRSDVVMKGYYKQPEKTAETVIDGWLHTGDIGHLDEDGFLHITDRKKDLIISGGFNVYPSEVEQILWSHPAVLDCAVIGVPHADWGEAVKAVIELKPGETATEEELITLCKEKLGSVKAPKSIDFTDTLPRSPVGKVLKKAIRDPYWENADRKI